VQRSNESRCAQSVAEHIPDHAGVAYSIREMTVAWKMSCRDVASVQHAAARRQQRGDVVNGCQPFVHNNSENPQSSLSLDVGARWRRCTVATRREDNLLRLVAVELEVICRRSCVQVLNLCLARVHTNAQYHQINKCRRRIILLHACTGCRSAVVTMYKAGPSADL